MKIQWMRWFAFVLLVLLSGCVREEVVEEHHRHRPPPPPPPGTVMVPPPGSVVIQPAPVVVVAPPPVCVEEGVVYGGVYVAEPPGVVVDYVSYDRNWYYWHPGLHIWVHARRPAGWRPREGAHIYHRWEEHPMYHREEHRDDHHDHDHH